MWYGLRETGGKNNENTGQHYTCRQQMEDIALPNFNKTFFPVCGPRVPKKSFNSTLHVDCHPLLLLIFHRQATLVSNIHCHPHPVTSSEIIKRPNNLRVNFTMLKTVPKTAKEAPPYLGVLEHKITPILDVFAWKGEEATVKDIQKRFRKLVLLVQPNCQPDW